MIAVYDVAHCRRLEDTRKPVFLVSGVLNGVDLAFLAEK